MGIVLIEICRIGAGSERERFAINQSVKPALHIKIIIQASLNVSTRINYYFELLFRFFFVATRNLYSHVQDKRTGGFNM